MTKIEHKAIVIYSNGIQKEIEPTNNNTFTLEEMQSYVEGYIEVIYLNSKQLMVVNEEGIRLKLPLNKRATQIANFYGEYLDVIYGTVVICSRKQVEGN
jgi:hypothetical protein